MWKGIIPERPLVEAMAHKHSLLFLTLLLMAVQIPFAHPAETKVTITPPNPVRGDLMKIDVSASPNESIDVQLSFTKTLKVASGSFLLEMDGVQIPPPPNNFSVKATGVTNLNVAVVIFFPITKSASASGGVATVSQGGVPAGNYNVRISGDAQPGVSSVSLLVTASTTITMDASGHYTYSYPTGSLPTGTVTANVGNMVKTLELTESRHTDSSPPTVVTYSPTGTINTDSPTIVATFRDDVAIDASAVRLMLNGVDVTSSSAVGSGSISYHASGLGNNTVNHVKLNVYDTSGNSAVQEWDFTVRLAARAPLDPAKIIYGDLKATPSRVEVGREVTIAVNLRNLGELTGNTTAQLLINGTLVNSMFVKLPGGSSQNLSFKYTPMKQGWCKIDVSDQVISLLVLPHIAHPNLEATKLEAQAGSKIVGEALVFDAVVSNQGECDSPPFKAVLRVAGLTIGSLPVDGLRVGGTEQLGFSWTPQAADIYDVTLVVDPGRQVDELDTADNTLTIQVEVSPRPTNWVLVATAALIAAVIVLAVSLRVRTRRVADKGGGSARDVGLA